MAVSPELRAAQTKARRWRKLRLDTQQARSELDRAILKAKDCGETYREIADQCGLTVAWVQVSLQRSGYSTAPRTPAG